MATDIAKNNIGFFLDGFLSRPASSIPKGAQWAVSFEQGTTGGLYDTIFKAIQLAYKYEPSSSAAEWNTLEAAKAIMTPEYQRSRGCLFCQAIGLPGDSQTPIVEGSIKSNAFVRSYVGAGREDFPVLRMTFLDTHVSFVDSFLRGWALATSNFGMIARDKKDARNYRTDLVCYKFGITPEGPVIIQAMTFKDICCIGVSEEEYTYNPASAPVLREARFIYNSYSVNTVSNNSTQFTSNIRPPNALLSSNTSSSYGPNQITAYGYTEIKNQDGTYTLKGPNGEIMESPDQITAYGITEKAVSSLKKRQVPTNQQGSAKTQTTFNQAQ